MRIRGSADRRCRCRGGLAGNGHRPRRCQASGKGSEPGPGRAQQSRQPVRTDGTVLLPLASGGPAMGHHSRPQAGRKCVILPWGPRASAAGGSVCPVGTVARERCSPLRSAAPRSPNLPYQQPPNPPGTGRLGGGVSPPRRRSWRVGSVWKVQSSRSLRLGVRLGSLARKPNTKIPMKKKTTE